ncbi:hypothetical protein TSAR_006862 [Trichomalopsis sarcophagae]|uniref:Uncharacterized protein n=1 Tax=Trichomalopsis sarcophagae TaxID=543379 RepID=A0A232ELY9_9HYME|nr:hypothetical protein TSAR_006862 [Trichomalopsis sarcophagae]
MPYFLTLKNPILQPHLNYRNNRKKEHNDNIEDVFDGDLYKRLSRPINILFDDNKFSCIFNTNGCQANHHVLYLFVAPGKHLSGLTVCGIEILLRNSISQEDILLADELLIRFVIEFENLYGKDQMTYNVHISIPLFSTYFPVGSRVLDFSENFKHEVKSCIKVDKAVVIGEDYLFNENEQQLKFFGSCLSYQKMIYNHRRYATKNNVENLKINDSVFETDCRNKGVIINICLVENDGEKKIVIFYHRFKIHKKLICNVENIVHIQQCTIEYDKLYISSNKNK